MPWSTLAIVFGAWILLLACTLAAYLFRGNLSDLPEDER